MFFSKANFSFLGYKTMRRCITTLKNSYIRLLVVVIIYPKIEMYISLKIKKKNPIVNLLINFYPSFYNITLILKPSNFKCIFL